MAGTRRQSDNKNHRDRRGESRKSEQLTVRTEEPVMAVTTTAGATAAAGAVVA